MFLHSPQKKNENPQIVEQFNKLYKACNDVTKCVIQTRELSKNQETLDKYCEQLTVTYNEFINFAKVNADNLERALIGNFREKLKKLKNRVAESLLRLKLKFNFDGDLYQEINDSNLEISFIEFSDSVQDDSEEKSERQISQDKTTPLETILSDETQANNLKIISGDEKQPNQQEIFPKNSNETNSEPLITFSHNTNTQSNNNTIMEPTAFLKLCSNTINKNYNGDPLGLEAFINSVMIVKTTTTNQHDNILRDVVISKLEANALEVLPDPKPTTTDAVLAALKSGIKLENSDIIMGKIIAMKSENLSAQEFSKKAEELALSLRRSYISEGITKAKANEMAIKETIKLCKASSKNVLVKSILSSASYTEPRDVIAKYLTETENEKTETKNNILTFRGNSQNRGNYHNNNGYTTQYRNNQYQNRRTFNNYNHNNYNNFNRNRSYGNNSYRNQPNRNNFGNTRYNNSNNNFGNTRNGNNNYNSRNSYRRTNGNNGNHFSNHDSRNIRYCSGNEDVSQSQERTLGTVTNNLNELTLQ